MEYENVDARVLARMEDRVNATKAVRRMRLRNLPPNPVGLNELGEIPDQSIALSLVYAL